MSAATRTWDGGGTDAKWDTVNNWDNNGLPANGDAIVFGTAFTSGTTLDLNGNRTIAGLTISTTAAFSLTNSTLTITNGDITRTDVAGTENDQTISSNIALGADGAWNIAGSGNFTVSGVVSGARKVTKSGAGTLILSGNNTYSNNLVLSAGSLGLGHDNAAGTGTFQISGGTVFASGGARTIGNALSLSADFTIGGSNDLTFSGNATLSADRTITVDNSGTTTFSGVISGNRKLIKEGAGTMVLSGANTYNKDTIINAGVINIRNSSALSDNTKTTVASGAALEIQGGLNVTSEPLEISGTGISSGGAFRNISGNNTWGGNITLLAAASIASDSGTLSIGGTITNGGFGLTTSGAGDISSSGIISGLGALTKTGTGTLTLSGVNTYTGGTNINGGILNVGGATALGVSGTISFGGGTLQHSASNTVDYSSRFSTAAGQAYKVDTNGQNVTWATALTSSGGTLSKTGTGTLTLTGTNTFSGATTVSGGTLLASGALGAALGSTSGITVNSGGTLQLGASNQINNSAAITMAGGTFAKGNFSEGATNAVGMGALTLTATGSHLDFGTGTVGALSFSSLSASTFTITVDNWTGTYATQGSAATDRLIFNSDQSSNLNHFFFTGYGAGAIQFNLGGGFFEIVAAVPEPGTWISGFLVLAGLSLHAGRRIRKRMTVG